MARKTKTGLEYFPLDVDFFTDSKVQLISSEFGSHSDSIILRLLCRVYRNGYFLEYNNDEGLLIAKSVGFNCTGGLVTEVVKGLVRRSFFDKRVYDQFSILTSKGIQKRYVEACERRQKVIMLQEYLLLQRDVYILPKNVTVIGLNVPIGTQSKVKESKGEESNNNNADENLNFPSSISIAQPPIPGDYEKFKDECLKDEIRFVAPQVASLSQKGLTLKTFPEWLDKFNTWLGVSGQDAQTIQQYRTHFANWMRKQDDVQVNSKFQSEYEQLLREKQR